MPVQPSVRQKPARAAFYDFDGTLVRGNVVTRYLWFVKRHPSRAAALWRQAKAVAGVPLWLGLDAVSRRWFNIAFFRQYRGLEEAWLQAQGREFVDLQVRCEQFRFAMERVERDRAEGFHTVLVSGGLDFTLAPAAERFGFDGLLANRLEYRDGVATGVVAPPLLADQEKADALRAYAADHGFDLNAARAYSDSGSDLPMLRAVGEPYATNPDARLQREARARGWAVLDLERSADPVPPDSA